MARIGIVLATYNGEKYLPQMLDSLIAQSRQADIIVAVDDGSKDSTPDIKKLPGPFTPASDHPASEHGTPSRFF